MNYLFLALSGKLVLLRVVINLVPLYHMAILKAPVGIIADMEKLMRGVFVGACWRGEGGFLG